MFYVSVGVFVSSLHNDLYGTRVQYRTTYDLARTGFYLYLCARPAVLQRRAFTIGHEVHATRLCAYGLSSLYRVWVAQGTVFDCTAGWNALLGNIANGLTGVEYHAARQS